MSTDMINKILECIKEMSLTVKFKKLHDDAVLPKYAKPGDAGMDCYMVDNPIVSKKYITYRLGFSVEIPDGYVGLLFPRSSISDTELMLANSVGVIDSSYRGEVKARFKPSGSSNILHRIEDSNEGAYAEGVAVCQLIILPYPKIKAIWADDLSTTLRGEGGFGSTSILGAS